jgi:two-component system response regulator DesR
VAEDNIDVAEIVAGLLAIEDGFDVVGRVQNAAEISSAIRRLHPDLLLLDLELNGVSGMRVLAECRRNCPDLRVAILSGHSAPAIIREALAAGAADFLVKPDDRLNLAERLRRLLSA